MYIHICMRYQFMKEEAMDLKEGGKGHMGGFEGSQSKGDML